jgi:hypothetical protein
LLLLVLIMMTVSIIGFFNDLLGSWLLRLSRLLQRPAPTHRW